MRGTRWNLLALAALAAMGMAACGGDQGGNETESAAPAAAPPAQAAPSADTGMSAAAGAQDTGATQTASNLPAGITQQQVNEGRQVFHGVGGCIACHGPDAKGTALAPDLTDNEWLHVSGRNYDEIRNLIKTGVPQPVSHPAPMPPMGGAQLTDEQVNAVAAYVVSLGQS